MALRSLCLSPSMNGRQYGRLKSPISSCSLSSEQFKADLIVMSVEASSLPVCISPMSHSAANVSTILLCFLLTAATAVSLLQCFFDAGDRQADLWGLLKLRDSFVAATVLQTAAGSIFSWSSWNWLTRFFGWHLALFTLPLLFHVLIGKTKDPGLRLENGMVFDLELPSILGTSGWAYRASILSSANELQTSC